MSASPIPRAAAHRLARLLVAGASVEWPAKDAPAVLHLADAQASDPTSADPDITALLERAAQVRLMVGLLQDTSLLPSLQLPGAPPAAAGRCTCCGGESPDSPRCAPCQVAVAIALDDVVMIERLAEEITG